jgi:hypothetical protein
MIQKFPILNKDNKKFHLDKYKIKNSKFEFSVLHSFFFKPYSAKLLFHLRQAKNIYIPSLIAF